MTLHSVVVVVVVLTQHSLSLGQKNLLTERPMEREDDPRAARLKERPDQSQRFLWNEQIKISVAARESDENK